MKASVRELREDEVRFFREHGWALLPGLVSRELAATIGAYAAEVVANPEYRAESAYVDQAFRQYKRPELSNPPSREVVLSPVMGRNATRLLFGASGVRLLQSSFLVKQARTAAEPSTPTAYHQDYPPHPLDRSEMLSFWIALGEITPEMGSMRFYDGSHRLGALGRCFREAGDATPNRYPGLSELPLSPPLRLAAGDATIHHSLTVHGAPENATATPRVALSIGYFDAATLYTGAPFRRFDPLGLKVDAPFDHPEFPLIA
jgi:hypothetical protein